jgi:signal transduction histidine kinase
MNVLIIEDSPDTTVNLREVLAFEGHGVIAVRTTREVAEDPHWSQVGAGLLDGCPPDGADGLLPSLREVAPHAPVIVITGHSDISAALTALRDGAAAGSLRAINPTALRANLARVARLSTREQEVVQAARLAGVGELAASVAHELNNSLGTVTLRLEGLLSKTPGDDPRRHALEVVDQEVERMAALVSNLLEFTRAGQGRASTVDVCDEVTKTVELTDHHLARKGVQVVPKFAPDVPLIQADRQHLRQVLLNLFTNAADAMPEGGPLTVTVRPRELPDGRSGVVIEVTDTGTGIPPDILPRVTETFFTTKGEGKGTGLGLAICNRIVEQHHGTLEIESQLGVGTTIRITLPVHPKPAASASRVCVRSMVAVPGQNRDNRVTDDRSRFEKP